MIVHYVDFAANTHQINIDWAGVLVERSTGLSLNAYLHRFVFEPLGLKNISMFPTPSMKANLAYMNSRAANGQLSPRDHLLRRPLIVETSEEINNCFNSGGAGNILPTKSQLRHMADLTVRV